MRFLVLVCLLLQSALSLDPYAALGLKRGAAAKDIKKAYKQLVREWHPDKNDSPHAAERFMEISKAYEVLNDPLKKERYDKFGTIDEGGHHEHHGGNPFGGFDSFFGGFGFGGFDQGDSFFSKHRISIRHYTHTILEKSYTQPFIIFAYSGYCRLCFAKEAVWQKAVEDLEPLGYGVATVNAMTDGNLLDKLRVFRLPTVLVLIEGRAIHYREDSRAMEAKSLRVFARDVIPDSFVLRINTYDRLKRFVDQASSTNKVSVLILGSSAEPRLRYLLAAMRLTNVARFAYVYLGEGTTEVDEMREAMSIKCTQCENVLVFDEQPEKGPVGRLSLSKASELKKEALDGLLDAHRFLLLPRISSPSHFDGLCPISSRSSRTLCVWLISTSSSDEAVHSFRTHFVSRHQAAMKTKNVKVAYISATSQSTFLRPFMETRSKDVENSLRDVMIIWRSESSRVRVSWLEGVWPIEGGNTAATKLAASIREAVEGKLKLENTVTIGEVEDEHLPNVFVRFSKKVARFMERAWFELSKEETYPVLSAILTFLLILIVGFALSHAGERQRMNYGTPRTMSTDSGWHPEDPRTGNEGETLRTSGEEMAQQHERRLKKAYSIMLPLMHELRAESYFGMIRLLKPGCRSIIILVDEDNKQQLLEQFALCIYPLRNNKTFSFGYLIVEKNLGWFRKLLEHTLPASEETEGVKAPSMYERLKSINPKQTVGTVLVLCGWKLYFCIYHPMHSATGRKNFLGFDDDGETDDDLSGDEKDEGREVEEEGGERKRRAFRPSVSNVLNGFPNWLDRLLEGSIRRYYIPEWPDNLH